MFDVVKYRPGPMPFNFLLQELIKKTSPKTIDAIFSRLEKESVHYLMTIEWPFLGESPIYNAAKRKENFLGWAPIDITKTIDPNTVAIIKYLDHSMLHTMLKGSINMDGLLRTLITLKAVAPLNWNIDKTIKKIKADFAKDQIQLGEQTRMLDACADNPPLLNEMIKKTLLADERLGLSIKALYSLNTDNLMSYLAQDPSIDISNLLQQKAYSSVVDWQYHNRFEERLKNAHKTLQTVIASSLQALQVLSHNYLPGPLTQLVFYYMAVGTHIEEENGALLMVENQSIINRVNYEIDKSSHEASLYAKAYYELSHYFQHAPQVSFKHDDAAIVLSYLAPYACIFNKTMQQVEKTKHLLTKPVPVPQKSFLDNISSFFITTPKPTVRQSNGFLGVEAAQRAITHFVERENNFLEEKPENSKSPRKTFLGLKHHYQARDNEPMVLQIKTLEKALEVAKKKHTTEALVSVVQAFDSKKGEIAPWFVTKTMATKKLYLSHKLKAEARQFGFECRDVKADGNCFFHAVTDQLSMQGLSALGASPEALRASAIDHIINHLEDYQNFLDQHDGDMDQFIAQNVEQGTWADHLIISALSRALNITMVIIRSDGVAPTICEHPQAIATLYLGHEVGQHYQSLVENTALAKTKFLPIGGVAAMGVATINMADMAAGDNVEPTLRIKLG